MVAGLVGVVYAVLSVVGTENHVIVHYLILASPMSHDMAAAAAAAAESDRSIISGWDFARIGSRVSSERRGDAKDRVSTIERKPTDGGTRRASFQLEMRPAKRHAVENPRCRRLCARVRCPLGDGDGDKRSSPDEYPTRMQTAKEWELFPVV